MVFMYLKYTSPMDPMDILLSLLGFQPPKKVRTGTTSAAAYLRTLGCLGAGGNCRTVGVVVAWDTLVVSGI